MSVGSYRRYCLLRARYWDEQEEPGLAATWRGKHLEAEGTTLAADFPHRAILAAAVPPYTTIEDITGASVAELVKYAGLTHTQAETALAALED